MVPRRSTRLAAVPSQPRPSRRSRRLAGKAVVRPRQTKMTTKKEGETKFRSNQKKKQIHKHKRGTLESRPRNILINRHHGIHENALVPHCSQNLADRNRPTTPSVPKEAGNKNEQKSYIMGLNPIVSLSYDSTPESKHGSPKASPVVSDIFCTQGVRESFSSNTSPESNLGSSKASPDASEIILAPKSQESTTRKNQLWIKQEPESSNEHPCCPTGGVKREIKLHVIVGGQQYERELNPIAYQSHKEKKIKSLVVASSQRDFAQVDNDLDIDGKNSYSAKKENNGNSHENGTIVDEENDNGFIMPFIRIPGAVRILKKGKQMVKRLVESIGYKYPSAAS